MTARFAAFQYDGIVLARVHGRRQLAYIGSRLLILTVKDAVESVKISFMDVSVVSNNIAAVLPYDKGIHQRLVGIQEKDLAHVFGRKSDNHGKAGASVGHGIFAGNAEQNDAVPAAAGGGGRFALSAPQAVQKRLRVVQFHRIAVDHLKISVGRIQGGAQKMPCLRTVLDLLPGAVIGTIPRRNVGDGFRHCQPEFDNRFKVQRYLLIHSGHVSGADFLNRAFAYIIYGYSQKGKHENR